MDKRKDNSMGLIVNIQFRSQRINFHFETKRSFFVVILLILIKVAVVFIDKGS